jgi:hypothetical protein
MGTHSHLGSDLTMITMLWLFDALRDPVGWLIKSPSPRVYIKSPRRTGYEVLD